MELFRSEDMKYVAITMTNESAHETVKELGKFAKFHVVDLSNTERGPPSKQHTQYKKRVADCQYWERKLQSFHDTMTSYGVTIPDVEPVEYKSGDVLESLQSFIEPIERELVLSVTFQKDNKRQIAEDLERRYVLKKCKNLQAAEQQTQRRLNPNSGKYDLVSETKDVETGAGDNEKTENTAFRQYVCGTIAIDQQPMFRRMLYRISRGNAFVRFADIDGPIEDPATGELQQKSVFYIVVLGTQLLQRIQRMCDVFHATVYDIPSRRDQFEQALTRINEDLKDKRDVNRRTEEAITNLLNKLISDGDTCPLKDWQEALKQEKAISTILMKAHYYLTMISLEGWVPACDLKDLKNVVKTAVAGTGHPPAAVETDPINPIRLPGAPPTYFKTNKFTETFQGIVDTYGVPRYKEVNPGLFTIITFPFLFGVMYGDIGHGLCVTIAAALMIHYEEPLLIKQKKGQLGEIFSMIFGGRYLLVMMGGFATYCGIIYNDCFSIALNVYGSNFYAVEGSTEYKWNGLTYPCGIDPAWAHKVNELAFYNSLKMKMAVIFGVCQMTFGIILSLYNHLYFKDFLSIYFEFIPRLIFMLSTFGYMCWMILYKWTVDWRYSNTPPPNLIQTMITMFLSPGSVEPEKQLYSGQAGFQAFLVIIAFLSVPCMLFIKPYIHKKRHEYQQSLQQHAPSTSNRFDFQSDEHDDMERKEDSAAVVTSSDMDDGEGDGHGEFNFGDEMIHQGIHTIEFVLGAVSNTASYLRLWALSLAHAQLSNVFWAKMMQQYGVDTGNPIMMFFGFGIWFIATFAVLLCMDTLECFLHALRLHWVEFQSKFYYADGIAFEPFTFVEQKKD